MLTAETDVFMAEIRTRHNDDVTGRSRGQRVGAHPPGRSGAVHLLGQSRRLRLDGGSGGGREQRQHAVVP